VSQDAAPARGSAAMAAPPAVSPASPDAPPAATLVYLTPVGDFIHSADAKAGTILAVLGIMFTLLARFGPWLDELVRGASLARFATVALLAGFAGAALGAVVQSFRTISPRFPPAAPSLAFFGDIARLSADEYVARATSLGTAEALAERLKYNHTGSRIILLKFRQLRRALRFFELAAACWLLLVTILALKAFLA
jgi:hypothetical protein